MAFGLLVLFASFNSAALTKRAVEDDYNNILDQYQRSLMSDSAESNAGNTVNLNRRNNYAQTCYGYQLSGTTLSATCRTINGNWISSSINLQSIVGNTNGQLTMRRRAMTNEQMEMERREMHKRAGYTSGYANSCSSISLSGTVLSATCNDMNGYPHQTTIDLNNRISNINGQLTIDN